MSLLAENIQKSQDLHTDFINKLVEKKSLQYKYLLRGKPTFYGIFDMTYYFSNVAVYKELEELIHCLPIEWQQDINERVQKFSIERNLKWNPDFKPVE
jgi:hypothetical protein